MNSSFCVILRSCLTGELSFVRGGNILTNPQIYDFWVANTGFVILANSPLFPDPSYYIESVCTIPPDLITPGSICLECIQNSRALNILNVTVTEQTECSAPDLINGYFLVNCKYSITNDILQNTDITSQLDPGKVLFTAQNLYFYNNQVIKIDEFDSNCYKVIYQTGGNQFNYSTDSIYTVTNVFEDCECCLETPPIFERTIPEPVKDFTIITEDQCVIDTNQKYSENVYNIYKQKAFGVNDFCSNIDLDRLWMQKEMVDYSKIGIGECVLPDCLLNVPEDVSATITFN